MASYASQRNGAYPVDERARLLKPQCRCASHFVRTHFLWRMLVADVQIQDGIIRIADLDIQDPKAAAVLAAYPQVRWAEITRRAVKIGLGYLKGGEKG